MLLSIFAAVCYIIWCPSCSFWCLFETHDNSLLARALFDLIFLFVRLGHWHFKKLSGKSRFMHQLPEIALLWLRVELLSYIKLSCYSSNHASWFPLFAADKYRHYCTFVLSFMQLVKVALTISLRRRWTFADGALSKLENCMWPSADILFGCPHFSPSELVVVDVTSLSGAAYTGGGADATKRGNSTRMSHMRVSPGFHLSLVKLTAVSLNGGTTQRLCVDHVLCGSVV